MQKTIKQIIQHVKRNGIEGLLPQNLPNNILDMLLSESDLDTTYSFDNGSIEVLIFVVLSLKQKKLFDTKINTTQEVLKYYDEIVDEIETYLTQLALEDLQRANGIKLTKNSLATLDNIFISKRDIKLTSINKDLIK